MRLQIVDVCEGGGHFTLSVSGDVSYSVRFGTAEFLEPLSDDEKDAFIKGIVRFARIGRTTAQVKTALLNGVTVTI